MEGADSGQGREWGAPIDRRQQIGPGGAVKVTDDRPGSSASYTPAGVLGRLHRLTRRAPVTDLTPARRGGAEQLLYENRLRPAAVPS